MRKPALLAAFAALAAALPLPAAAELPKGAKAPQFATQGARAGGDFAFNLKAELRKGPVVLYFYPKAFTQGCTLEAHAFSEAVDDFRKAGATVIGMSADDVPTLKKFSTEHCRDKFAVASASPALLKSYDVELKKADGSLTGLSSRTSYVIGRDGRIKFAYSNMDFRDHVRLSLAAVRALKRGR
jgi:peroxiredoxin